MIMHSQDSLKAGAVAKAAGVGVQTLHYYERLGLLQKPKRSAANYRLYAPEAVRRVRFIKKAQALGLTLEETKQILDLKDHGREPCRKVAELGENICRKSMRVSCSCAPIVVRLRKRSTRGPRKIFPSGIARVSFAISSSGCRSAKKYFKNPLTLYLARGSSVSA